MEANNKRPNNFVYTELMQAPELVQCTRHAIEKSPADKKMTRYNAFEIL